MVGENYEDMLGDDLETLKMDRVNSQNGEH